MGLTTVQPGPASQPTDFSSRIDSAVAAAKSAARRRIPAVAETALTETYRRHANPAVPLHAGMRLKLAIDENTGMVIGRIVDRGSGKVVNQIPSDDMLRLIALTKEALGPLVNEKV